MICPVGGPCIYKGCERNGCGKMRPGNVYPSEPKLCRHGVNHAKDNCKWCGHLVPLAAPYSSSESAQPVHTDHPLRHWDRTCPACVAEGQSDKVGPCGICLFYETKDCPGRESENGPCCYISQLERELAAEKVMVEDLAVRIAKLLAASATATYPDTEADGVVFCGKCGHQR